MSVKENKKAPAVGLGVKTRKQPVNQNAFSVPPWALPVVLICTGILYSKAIFCDLTVLDDDFYITNNPAIRDFSFHGIKTLFTSYYVGHYQPVTMLMYMLEYKLFQLNPVPYHLLDVFLHLVNIALVFKLTERLSGRNITALIVAILFAIHPLQVQSVAWVSELKNVLYTVFYLLALLLYLRYLASGYRPVYYLGVILLFLVSLLCKSAAVTLPVLLLVFDFYKGRKLTTRSVLEKAPLIGMSLVFGIVAIISQKEAGANYALLVSYGPVNGFFVFMSGLAFYFTSTIVPFWLSIFHYFPDLQNGFLPWGYYASLPVVLLVLWFVMRKSPIRKEVWFGFAFFMVAISVMLKLVSVGSGFVAEQYVYLAYIGLFYIVAQLVTRFLENDRYRSLTIGIFSAFVLIILLQTWNRVGVWKNDYTIFNELINKNPTFCFGYWFRGNIEKRDGNLNAAFADYSKAIELNSHFGDSYYNRGIVNNALGNLMPAINDYNQAIGIDPKQADAYNNRGWVYFELGNIKAAMEDYQRALSLKPDYSEAYNNLGWAYEQTGDAAAAMQNYTKAIATQPDFKKPRYNLAGLKSRTGDLNGALQQYNLLINLYPEENIAYTLRGKVSMELKDMQSACADWQKAHTLGNQYAGELLHQYCR